MKNIVRLIFHVLCSCILVIIAFFINEFLIPYIPFEHHSLVTVAIFGTAFWIGCFNDKYYDYIELKFYFLRKYIISHEDK